VAAETKNAADAVAAGEVLQENCDPHHSKYRRTE